METPTVNVQGSLINPFISIWKGLQIVRQCYKACTTLLPCSSKFQMSKYFDSICKIHQLDLSNKRVSRNLPTGDKKKKRTMQMRGDIHFFAFLQVKIHKGRGCQNGLQCEVWKGLRPNNIPDQCFKDGVLFLLQWKIATATAGGKQSKDHPPLKNETCQQVIKNSRALQ